MNRIGPTIGLLLASVVISWAQTTRYFEFAPTCGHGNWQDTAFIASTSDQELIDTVLANLSRPLNERKFISGHIDHGHGGHNHNAGHWFMWHFVPNEWDLVDMATEVCDGCPYSDIDADISYWIENIGIYCPWGGRPVREVGTPLGVKPLARPFDVSIYPNPGKGILHLKWKTPKTIAISIHDPMGQRMADQVLSNGQETIDISHLPAGLYFLKISDGITMEARSIVIGQD